MKAHRNRLSVMLETLEPRAFFSVTVESIDGGANNLQHPTWGATGTDLLRIAPAQYADGISTMAGPTRPSARAVSVAVASDATDGGIPNSRSMSDWVYAWGQLIDHDLDLTGDGTGTQLQSANIAVPTGDTSFDPNSTGSKVIGFNRSEFDPATGTSAANPRQNPNDISAYLDGSMIYGSDAIRANALRSHIGGQLNTSAGNMLPFNIAGLPNANSGPTPNAQLFLAGDVRANENIELTSVQTLFMREHNRIAAQIQKTNPKLTDEQIYQQARAQVIAEIQSITYNEFLPALLGQNAIPKYTGYKSDVNAQVSNEFSTAAYRFGHSLLAPDVQFMNPDGTTKDPSVSLANSFFNPALVSQNGIDSILKYLSSDNAQEVDTKIVPELQNFLFGKPGQGGFDLASLNIQRGRDHGLADYNSTRAAYGLPRVTSFAQITSDTQLQAKLQQLYGSVDSIDLWVGGLAENHAAGASMGPLFQRIIANQFQRTRDGDRFYFENQFSGETLQKLQHTTLAQIISRNTSDTILQSNVFYYRTEISGRVNGDGPHRPGTPPPGVAGQTVDLVDATDGVTKATTATDSNGIYHFTNLTGLDLGSYTVRTVLSNAGLTTTYTSPLMTLTQGETYWTHIDLGIAPPPRGPHQGPPDHQLPPPPPPMQPMTFRIPGASVVFNPIAPPGVLQKLDPKSLLM